MTWFLHHKSLAMLHFIFAIVTTVTAVSSTSIDAPLWVADVQECVLSTSTAYIDGVRHFSVELYSFGGQDVRDQIPDFLATLMYLASTAAANGESGVQNYLHLRFHPRQYGYASMIDAIEEFAGIFLELGEGWGSGSIDTNGLIQIYALELMAPNCAMASSLDPALMLHARTKNVSHGCEPNSGGSFDDAWQLFQDLGRLSRRDVFPRMSILLDMDSAKLGFAGMDAYRLRQLLDSTVTQTGRAPSFIRYPVDPISPVPKALMKICAEHSILIIATDIFGYRYPIELQETPPRRHPQGTIVHLPEVRELSRSFGITSRELVTLWVRDTQPVVGISVGLMHLLPNEKSACNRLGNCWNRTNEELGNHLMMRFFDVSNAMDYKQCLLNCKHRVIPVFGGACDIRSCAEIAQQTNCCTQPDRCGDVTCDAQSKSLGHSSLQNDLQIDWSVMEHIEGLHGHEQLQNSLLEETTRRQKLDATTNTGLLDTAAYHPLHRDGKLESARGLEYVNTLQGSFAEKEQVQTENFEAAKDSFVCTKEFTDQYWQRGFNIAEQVLSEQQMIASWRALERLYKASYKQLVNATLIPAWAQFGAGDDFIEEMFTEEIIQLHSVLTGERLLAAIRCILSALLNKEVGIDEIAMTPQIRVLGKMHGQTRQHAPWHQDAAYWWVNLRHRQLGGIDKPEVLDLHAMKSVTAFIALTETDFNKGALAYKVGSHAEGFAGAATWEKSSSYATNKDVEHDFGADDVETVPQRAGDALLHTQYTHHGSHDMSEGNDAVRWTIEVRYTYLPQAKREIATGPRNGKEQDAQEWVYYCDGLPASFTAEQWASALPNLMDIENDVQLCGERMTHGYNVWNGQFLHFPLVGLGTGRMAPELVPQAVADWIAVGGRMIDTARMYGNHQLIEAGIRLSNAPRMSLFILDKVWPSSSQDVVQQVVRSLEELNTVYLDSVLVHWPGSTGGDHDLPKEPHPDCGTWKECRRQTWHALCDLHNSGYIRSVGVSNYAVRHLQEIQEEHDSWTSLRDVDIPHADILDDMSKRGCLPAFHQYEHHPWYRGGPGLARYQVDNNIVPLAYAPLGSPEHIHGTLNDEVVLHLAEKYGLTPAAVLLKFSSQFGLVPMVTSTNKDHMRDNLAAVDISSEIWLEDEDLQMLLAASDKVYKPLPEEIE